MGRVKVTIFVSLLEVIVFSGALHSETAFPPSFVLLCLWANHYKISPFTLLIHKLY